MGDTSPSEKRCEGGKDLKERIDIYPVSEIVCRFPQINPILDPARPFGTFRDELDGGTNAAVIFLSYGSRARIRLAHRPIGATIPRKAYLYVLVLQHRPLSLCHSPSQVRPTFTPQTACCHFLAGRISAEFNHH